MLSKIIGDTIVKCWSLKHNLITELQPTDGKHILYTIFFCKLFEHETKEIGNDQQCISCIALVLYVLITVSLRTIV